MTKRISDMLSRFVIAAAVLAALMFSLPARAQYNPRTPFPAPDQNAPPAAQNQEKHIDGWYKEVPAPPKDQRAAPAPRRDLSGIWEPAGGWGGGGGVLGGKGITSGGEAH